MCDWLKAIDSANDTGTLNEVVFDFLRSIGEEENAGGEAYSDTAERLYEAGSLEHARVMEAAEEKWWELEGEAE